MYLKNNKTNIFLLFFYKNGKNYRIFSSKTFLGKLILDKKNVHFQIYQ